jgi:hypothetical protein
MVCVIDVTTPRRQPLPRSTQSPPPPDRACMTINLNPALPVDPASARPAQDVGPAQDGEAHGSADAASRPGGQGPTSPATSGPMSGPASGADRLTAVTTRLEALLAAASLQGTLAVGTPEINQSMAPDTQADADANHTDVHAPRAAELASRTSADNTSNGPLRTTDLRASGDALQRSGSLGEQLAAPTSNASASANASLSNLAMSGLAWQPAAIASTIDTPVGGFVQVPTPARDAGEAHYVVRRRKRRDGRSSHDEPELFEDDLPEHRVRTQHDGRDQADDAGDDMAAGVMADIDDAPSSPDLERHWPTALARTLATQRPGSAGMQALMRVQVEWARDRAVLFVFPQRRSRDEAGVALLVRAQRAGGAGESIAAMADAPERHGRDPSDPRDASNAPGPSSAESQLFTAGTAGTSITAAGVGRVQGERYAARLHWRPLPAGLKPLRAQWWAVRTVKQHGVALGRQLRAAPIDDLTKPDGLNVDGLAVQLGPVLLPHAREWDLRVRMDAVQNLWAALEDQWSVLIVGCSEPLIALAVRHH